MKNRKRHRAAAAGIAVILLAAVAAAYFIMEINPPKDDGGSGAPPTAYFCETGGNYIAPQTYHGDVTSLKQRLTAGVPVIAFVSIPGDTHYLAVVGYDAQYLYLADSLAQTADSSAAYNRRLTTAEFEAIWHTATPLSDNIYVVVSR